MSDDEGYKVDASLENVYVLVSAFVDGENIIPVKLEVKEFSDKENTLYVAVALESIKKNEIVKQEVATNGVARQYSPSFTVSISDLLRKINPSDESFYKYIPKRLLEASKIERNISVRKIKSGNGQVLNVKSNDSPQPTSETLLDGITATDSITEKSQIVNSNSKKSATDRAADTEIRFALPYEAAVDKLENGTLDITQSAHFRALEQTPQIYIDKVGASDREIVMSWDIAYLAMNKNGSIPDNYHGPGADIIKALPDALKDPLYIVKQKNGRIAAVTKIVVKGKRAVFASIEWEAYQTTIQEGKSEAKKYNLIVAVTDAKPNYLQNPILSGEIVHNKNSEDPAHFILRLKSLKKAALTYDLAESSDDSIIYSAENVNRNSEISSDERHALPKGNIDNAEKYSYEALTKKSELSVVTFPKELPLTDKGDIDKNAVVAHGRLNDGKQKNRLTQTRERMFVLMTSGLMYC